MKLRKEEKEASRRAEEARERAYEEELPKFQAQILRDLHCPWAPKKMNR